MLDFILLFLVVLLFEKSNCYLDESYIESMLLLFKKSSFYKSNFLILD